MTNEHTACPSIEQQVEEALSSPFFLSLQTPLPASTTQAALFIRDSPNGEVIAFWNTQLDAIKTLVGASLPIDEQWNKLTPTFLKPAAGKVELGALMSLALQFDLGGDIWLQQFLFGFELAGALSRKDSYPVNPKAQLKTPFPQHKLFNSSASRFHDRARKSGRKNAHALWAEALQKTEKGMDHHSFTSYPGRSSVHLKGPQA